MEQFFLFEMRVGMLRIQLLGRFVSLDCQPRR